MLHPSLPQSLTPESLASWLNQNCKEKFTEERRTSYTEDEMLDFKDRAMKAGIEINDLTEEKKRIVDLLEKGISDYTSIDLLPSKGIKQLKIERTSCEKEVKRGYFAEKIVVYGIPNQDTKQMDFFDVEGNEIPERRRDLSAKETREYLAQLGMFNPNLKAS